MRKGAAQRAAYLADYIRRMFAHPLNRSRPFGTALRYLRWHVGSRVLAHPVAYPFVNELRVLVGTGMWGATGVAHFGLEEFEDMAFCAHWLDADSMLVDVGANYGTFSLIGAGVAGARVEAVEANPRTAAALRDNLRLNNLEARVSVHNVAAGPADGELFFSDGLRAGDHVLSAEEAATQPSLRVPQQRLDALVRLDRPAFMKIDVEGFEGMVLAGAGGLLADGHLQVVLVEDVGLGQNYPGCVPVTETLLAAGFARHAYDPFSRQLSPLAADAPATGRNSIWLRDAADAAARVRCAPPLRVMGQSL
ncbi:MAG TPA: FkbM family methyltransferase [Solimonas sp.]|nr:FkbM family methyltransferase [Solimonas sp.]